MYLFGAMAFYLTFDFPISERTVEQSLTEIMFMYLQSIKSGNQSVHLIPETWEATWTVGAFRWLSWYLCLLFIQLLQERPWINPMPKKKRVEKVEGRIVPKEKQSTVVTCVTWRFFFPPYKIVELYQTLCGSPQQKGRCATWLSFDRHK